MNSLKLPQFFSHFQKKGKKSSKATAARLPPELVIEGSRTDFTFKPREFWRGQWDVPTGFEVIYKGMVSQWNFYFKWNEVSESEQQLGVFLRVDPKMPRPNYDHEGRNKIFIPSQEAAFAVEIVNANNPSKNRTLACKRKDYMSIPSRSWGIPNVISAKCLPNFEAEDGSVTFILDFYFIKEKSSDSHEPTNKESRIATLEYEEMIKCMTNVYEEVKEQTPDMLIKTKEPNGISLPGHRLILGGRSEYFRKVLEERKECQLLYPMERLDNSLTVEVNYSGPTMKIILCHIYHGHLPLEWIHPEKVPPELAREIVAACEEFGLVGLKRYYEDFYPNLNAALVAQ